MKTVKTFEHLYPYKKWAGWKRTSSPVTEGIIKDFITEIQAIDLRDDDVVNAFGGILEEYMTSPEFKKFVMGLSHIGPKLPSPVTDWK